MERQYLSPEEAAGYIGYARNTLQRWRSLGIGPKYIKRRRLVKYERTELDRWLTEQPVGERRQLTAEALRRQLRAEEMSAA